MTPEAFADLVGAFMATKEGKEFYARAYEDALESWLDMEDLTYRRSNARADAFKDVAERVGLDVRTLELMVPYSTLQDQFTAHMWRGSNPSKIARKVMNLIEYGY